MTARRFTSSYLKAIIAVLTIGCASAVCPVRTTHLPTATVTASTIPTPAPPPHANAPNVPVAHQAAPLSAAQARAIAEQEVSRLDVLFANLSLEPIASEPDAHRFTVKGERPGAGDAVPLGFAIVYADRRVAFQEADSEDVFSIDEELHREESLRQGIATIYRLPEVSAYCKANAPRCVHLVEASPGKGCTADDNDKRQCAWSISIRTLQGIDTDAPHMTNIVGFYAREDGKLFVEPIETGEVVHLEQWRCLLRHDFDAAACPSE